MPPAEEKGASGWRSLYAVGNNGSSQTPADTTLAERTDALFVPSSNRHRKRRCRRRVSSTSPRHAVAVSRWRISQYHSQFERL